jgi:hypothetical protein
MLGNGAKSTTGNLFSDVPGEWRAIPNWARFLLDFGFTWPDGDRQPRRIALVSMPCDSAAAGMIALGALVRDLAIPHATDIQGHYDRLMNYAHQFLRDCEPCNMKCSPEVKNCGHSRQATGILRSTVHPGRKFTISPRTDFVERKLYWVYPGGMIEWRAPEHACGWYIAGEPPAQWDISNGQIQTDVYQSIFSSAISVSNNLQSSYSGLCFAGRSTGENAARAVCATARFSAGGMEHQLDDLLTIHGWSSSGVSRMAYFNTRTERLDRHNATPKLVIADGDAAFLKVMGASMFSSSDIIAVVHRNIDREKLEAVGIKMQPNQWFEVDEDMLCALPSNPRAISISILRERTLQ